MMIKTEKDLEDFRIAVIRGNLQAIKQILNSDVSVNQTLKGGWSPLMFACSMGSTEIVKFLLNNKADPNFHKELFTPLMAACASTWGNEEHLYNCTELLIKHGANVNAAERHRLTALMFAAKEGHAKLVDYLLTAGAQCNSQDYQGWTALFWAINQGKKKVAEILIKHGAKLDIKDRKGQTALDLAYCKGLLEIAKIFNSKSNNENGKQIDCNDIYFNSDNTEKNISDHLKNNDKFISTEHDEILLNFHLSDMNLHSPVIKTSHEKSFNNNLNYLNNMFSDSNDESTPLVSLKPYYSNCSEAINILERSEIDLKVIYARVSYLRLRLQGHPLNLPMNDEATYIDKLKRLTEKVFFEANILEKELYFLNSHLNNRMPPADICVVDKSSNISSKIKKFCFIAIISIVSYFNFKKYISIK